MSLREPDPEISTLIFALGIMSGVICAIWGIAAAGHQASAEFKTSDLATLLAGFGGAALGGAVSWLLSDRAARITLLRDNEHRQMEEKSAAIRALLKLVIITNDLNGLSKHIAESVKAAPVGAELWQSVIPILGTMKDTPTFEAADLYPLLNAKRPDLVNRMMEISMRHKSTHGVIDTYNREHVELQGILRPYSVDVGDEQQVTSVQIPEKAEVKNPIFLRIRVLNNMMKSIIAAVSEDSQEAKLLSTTYSEVMKARFPNDDFPMVIHKAQPTAAAEA